MLLLSDQKLNRGKQKHIYVVSRILGELSYLEYVLGGLLRP